VARCEDHNLIVFVGFLKAFEGVGADIYSCPHCFTVGKGNLDFLITGVILDVINTVDEGLVQVEDYGLLCLMVFERWQLNGPCADVLLVSGRQCLYVLQRLKSLNQMIPVQFRALEIFNSVQSLLFIILSFLIILYHFFSLSLVLTSLNRKLRPYFLPALDRHTSPFLDLGHK
jgi:hypothetical protein